MNRDLTISITGLDRFGIEVDLCGEEPPLITEKLNDYARKHCQLLRDLIGANQAESEPEEETALSEGCLLIYYYFSDWRENPDFVDHLKEGHYPCFPVSPEDIEMTRESVLVILDHLPPVEGECASN